MQILKAQVKPGPNGSSTVTVWARDDAGHLLESHATSLSSSDVVRVTEEVIRSLAVLAGEITEEEDFEDDKNK